MNKKLKYSEAFSISKTGDVNTIPKELRVITDLDPERAHGRLIKNESNKQNDA